MMGKLADFVSYIKLPRMMEVRQRFNSEKIEDIRSELLTNLNEAGVADRISNGKTVAITAGSRGISNIQLIIKTVVDFVINNGGKPFIVPAMGSHGGATAKGQLDILEALEITEETCGCPIKATMDTEIIGYTKEHRYPVHVDSYAMKADAIIVVGRIKPHPSFSGRIESGLAKMAVIGLGKQKGAALCHRMGMMNMSANIQEISEYIFKNTKVVFGVGIVENAYDETLDISVIKTDEILKKEPELLKKAYENQPEICFKHYDTLLVEEMGKDISGAGLDTGIISRYTHDGIPKDIRQQTICVLDLTEGTHGNACGMGLVDVATKRFKDKIDFQNTYPNLLTSRIYGSAKMPLIMEDDKSAIQAAIHGCVGIDYEKPKLVWMKNTLDIGRLFISEELWEETKTYPSVELEGEPFEMQFDKYGNLKRIDEINKTKGRNQENVY